jgi:hypothetical protein
VLILSELFLPLKKKMTENVSPRERKMTEKNSVKAPRLEPPRFDAIFFFVISRSLLIKLLFSTFLQKGGVHIMNDAI